MNILPIIDEYKVVLEENQKIDIGTFTIMCFSLVHDVPIYGYLVKDNLSGAKLLYCTDTGMINYTFKDIDYFLIESNCDENELTYEDYKETRLYDTHLSMQQTATFIKDNANVNTKIVMLCHISSSESNYMKHQEYVEQELNNQDIKVIAIDPHLKKPMEIVLKEDINIDFD